MIASVNASHIHPANRPAHLLLIEDDAELRAHLARHFASRGFRVDACERGDTGLHLAEQANFDLVLLDIMMPGLDGLSVLARLRQQRSTPVMLMSALGAEQDRITGFTQGADDYLPKPFSLAELDARTDALLRRVAMDRLPPRTLPPRTSVAQGASGLRFDMAGQEVFFRDQPAQLTGSEFRLLALMNEHLGEPLSKPFLYQQVLHRAYTRLDRGLDVHVCNIRRKLSAIGVTDVQIQSVRNQGYILVCTATP